MPKNDPPFAGDKQDFNSISEEGRININIRVIEVTEYGDSNDGTEACIVIEDVQGKSLTLEIRHDVDIRHVTNWRSEFQEDTWYRLEEVHANVWENGRKMLSSSDDLKAVEIDPSAEVNNDQKNTETEKFGDNRGGKKIPSPKLKKDLHRLEEELGKPPSRKDVESEGEYSAGAYKNRFGSLKQALEETGIGTWREQYSEEDMLSDIREVAEDIGRSPSAKDMRIHGNLSDQKYTTVFGSWEDALDEAGLNYWMDDFTDDDIIDDIIRIADDMDKIPTKRDMKNNSGLSGHIEEYFDSWGDAILQAGYRRVGQKGEKVPDEELLDELTELSEKLYRLRDFVTLQPTDVQELSGEWEVGGDEARDYLRSELDGIYTRKSAGLVLKDDDGNTPRDFEKVLEEIISKDTEFHPQTYQNRFGSLEELYSDTIGKENEDVDTKEQAETDDDDGGAPLTEMIYRESEASEEEKDTGGIDDKDEVLLSQFDNLSVSLEDLSVKKLRRLHDLVSLAPTSFQELSEEWGVSIDDARKYSRSELSEYYEVKSTGISPTARASGKIKSFRKKLETEIIEVTDYDPQTYRDRFGSIENLYFEDLEEDLYGESVLELSSDGLRVNRVFKRPLTGGQTEVTIEEIKPASLPREGLNLHVKTIQVDREGKVRLYFKRTSKSKSDTEYLLYPTPEGGKLKEMRERVFDEGEKEVTVESIDSDQGLIKDVGLQVLKINLDAEVGGQDIPVLKLTEVRED